MNSPKYPLNKTNKLGCFDYDNGPAYLFGKVRLFLPHPNLEVGTKNLELDR